MKKAMRFLTVAFVAAMALAVTGCQKDPEDLIIGSWQVESQVYTTTAGSHTHTETETMEPGETGVITFNKDLSFVATSTWVEDGETTSESWRGTYSISGDLLTVVSTHDGELQSDVETMTFTIKSLDKKEMVLVLSETESANYTYSVETKLKRM